MSYVETVKLIGGYGPLERGQEYRVMHRGRDYVTVKRGGSLIHVPNNMIAPPGYRFNEYVERRDDEEEDEYGF